MNDSYAHVESYVFYITENILGPVEQSTDYEQLLNHFNSQLVEHCNCDRDCSLLTCKCLQKSYSGNDLVTSQNQPKHITESLPIFECNESCTCSYSCCNRIVQQGPIKGLEIKPTDKGFGLYTTLFISKGTFICEYAGELITKTQASARHQANLINSKMNYIFCLKEHFGENVIKTFVDPSIFGNIGRYINHSCEPNCHIVPVRCESPVPKLAIFASVNILSGDELTFNYGSTDLNDRLVTEGRIHCLCKTKNCAGYIPFCGY